MELFEKINGAVNDFVWGWPAIILIFGVGLYLTIRLKGLQFRNWGFMIHETYGKLFKGTKKSEAKEGGEGEITSFQAAMTSVSAVVGSGNIAGIATAIVCGGPGALFWMLVAAIVGMATKYAEIGLGVKYREKSEDGTYLGGPMYYISKGLHAPWLGKVVAVLFIFFSIVISAVVDTNTISGAFNESFGVNPIITGVVLAVITGIIIFGGIKRIGEVCGLLAPFMAGAYLLCGLIIIVMNVKILPQAIGLIFSSAFNPQAALGGAAGIGIITAVRYGMARGMFSNEAGIGSAAVTHAAAKVNSPGEQAIWGPLEVFVDTGIVCTITGLSIVLYIVSAGLTGAEFVDGKWQVGAEGVALTMTAFQKLLPGNWGQYVVLGASLLFGFSCLITYYNYLEKGWLSLFGKGKNIARIIWLIFIVVGSYSTLGFVWDLADTCNGLIIIPNLIALAVMVKEVIAMKEDYYKLEMPKYKEEKKKK